MIRKDSMAKFVGHEEEIGEQTEKLKNKKKKRYLSLKLEFCYICL